LAKELKVRCVWALIFLELTKQPSSYYFSNCCFTDVMMLTTDVGLTFDTIYKKYLNQYRSDLDSFNHDFSHAWYKLMTRDMGPYQRCRGDAVPPPQPFQFPLPDPNYGNLADFQEVATAIRTLMATSPEVYPEAFARLASQCSGSFRETDYQGGCNGAFIRFEPAQSYSSNEGSAATLEVLASIKEQFGDGLSWADLMVIAGTTSVVSSGALPMEFCGGRTDGSINQEQPELEPLWSFSSTDLTGTELKHFGAAQVGLTNREFVAITGYRSVGQKGLRARSPTNRDPEGGVWLCDFLFSAFFLYLFSGTLWLHPSHTHTFTCRLEPLSFLSFLWRCWTTRTSKISSISTISFMKRECQVPMVKEETRTQVKGANSQMFGTALR
jgi:hypothetical protein